jgi:hypothetical protein
MSPFRNFFEPDEPEDEDDDEDEYEAAAAFLDEEARLFLRILERCGAEEWILNI